MRRRFHPVRLLRRACPRCGARMFSGLFSMREDCPGCGLDFDRGQPGYFMGAVYLSYGFVIPLFAMFTVLAQRLFPRWSFFGYLLLAWGLCLPLVPWIWQYSRTLWVHFDQWLDPSRRGDETPESLIEE